MEEGIGVGTEDISECIASVRIRLLAEFRLPLENNPRAAMNAVQAYEQYVFEEMQREGDRTLPGVEVHSGLDEVKIRGIQRLLWSAPMTIAVPQPLNLAQFLKLPYIEESPAWEFIDEEAIQKPMPGGKHSRLQSRLAATINASRSRYEAFPELRCTFGGRSIVPDLAVIGSDRIPVDQNGDIISTGIEFAPEWVIEILSPDQSQTKVTRKILHSLRHGSQLGWLLDPDERVVLLYHPDSLPEECVGDVLLPGLPEINLKLTVEQMFSWLKVGGL